MGAPVPQFFLYGEPPQAVGDHFLHIEALDERTRPADWNIRPHRHGSLCHLFHIADGGGEMRADGERLQFSGPCLLVVPPNVVHAFRFQRETHGSVLTIADSYLAELVGRERPLAAAMDRPRQLPLEADETILWALGRLAREVSWQAPGHATAVDATLSILMIETLRLATRLELDARPLRLGSHAALVAQFRAEVEQAYRAQLPVEAYAKRLAVQTKRLRTACATAAAKSPLEIIHDRLMLEAKRLLSYSNMTVAEIGYFLGFEDPAYFSRFFSRHEGVGPREFRAALSQADNSMSEHMPASAVPQ